MLLILDFEIKKIPATLLNSKGLDRLCKFVYFAVKSPRVVYGTTEKVLNLRAFFIDFPIP